MACLTATERWLRYSELPRYSQRIDGYATNVEMGVRVPPEALVSVSRSKL